MARSLVGLALPLLLLASALGLAAVHVADLLAMDLASGVWLGLAQYLNHGVFYPPLESHGYYGGTRYMPLFFCVHALLAQVTGEYLVSGKLLSLGAVLLIMAGIATAAGRRTGSTALGIGMACFLPAFKSGLFALVTVRGDALPVAFSIWGLLLAERAQERSRSTLPAAALFAAAFFTKVTALAGCGAALVVLKGWRRRVGFALEVLLLCLLGLALTQGASQGRFLENLRATGSAGQGLGSLLRGPGVFLVILTHDPALLVMLPLALAVAIRDGLRRQVGPWTIYWLLTVLVTLVIFSSPGTALNHFIDLEAASLILLSREIPALARPSPSRTTFLLQAAGAGLLVCALLIGISLHFRAWKDFHESPDLRPEAVIHSLPPDASLLAEDATVPVLMGQRPVVLDPFMYRVLAEKGILNDADLAGRITRREFTVVLLEGRIELPGQSFCPTFHFGNRVTEAIKSSYRFDRRIGNSYVYVSNLATPAAPAGTRSGVPEANASKGR